MSCLSKGVSVQWRHYMYSFKNRLGFSPSHVYSVALFLGVCACVCVCARVCVRVCAPVRACLCACERMLAYVRNCVVMCVHSCT